MTDAGLKHLAGQNGLGALLLNGTGVTAAGVLELQQAQPHGHDRRVRLLRD